MSEDTAYEPGVTLTRSDGILYLVFENVPEDAKEQEKQAEYFKQRFMELYQATTDEQLDVILDARKVSSITFLAPKARELYFSCYKMPKVGRVAFVGMKAWLKTMIAVFTGLVGRYEGTKWFDTEEDAVAWLKT